MLSYFKKHKKEATAIQYLFVSGEGPVNSRNRFAKFDNKDDLLNISYIPEVYNYNKIMKLIVKEDCK